MMIQTNYAFHSWSSWFKTALLTTVFAFLHATLLNAQTTCTAEAGTLSSIEICFQRNQLQLKAIPQGDTTVPSGFRILYVLTRGDELVIEAVSEDPRFTIDQTDNGLYTIHTLVYDSTTLDLDSIEIGITTGFDILDSLIQGGGRICGALDTVGARVRFGACEEDSCTADAGRLAVAATSDSCFENGSARLVAQVQTAPVVPSGYSIIYVLTSGTDLVIEQVNDSLSFTVDTTGRYTIHTLVYDSTTLDLDSIDLGTTTGAFIDSLFIQGGGDICGALDVTGAIFNLTACNDTTGVDTICNIRAGTVRLADSTFCFRDSSATLTAVANNDALVPPGFARIYVLTSGDGNNLIIEQEELTPRFTVDTVGRYRIHSFVYDTTDFDLLDSIVVFGQSRVADLLPLSVQGGGTICAALDTVGVLFNVIPCDSTDVDTSGVDTCGVRLGTFAIANEDFCFDDSTGRATLSVNTVRPAIIPAGYTQLYVLTSGDSLIIEDVDTIPSFTVDTTGRFRIHTLVFDSSDVNLADSNLVRLGQTSALTLLPLLVQGGGTICATLDTAGVIFDVILCDSIDVIDTTCDIRAGTLRLANDDFCFNDSTNTATLTAIANNDALVPPGFARIYVLTSGDGDSLVIEQEELTPSFTVDTTGRFRIHSFVYDTTDFAFLDSIIVFGQTLVADVLPLSVQGGGDICAALDTVGVIFDVILCDSIDVIDTTCNIRAGTLRLANDDFCFNDSTNTATLTAVANNDALVPPGFARIYILTSGDGDSLVIEQEELTPSFTVDTTGRFRIHSFVYDTTDFAFLDSIIVFGQTLVADVLPLSVQGGGDICAALDTVGVIFDVISCDSTNTDSCGARAGTVRLADNDFCLRGDSVATLRAAVITAATIPTGYQRIFVLTSTDSLIIEAVSAESTFTVDTTGRYRIHPLVYDSTTLDLSIVQFGVTSAATINSLLIQGGGEICAALDVTGVIFDVVACTTDTIDVDVDCDSVTAGSFNRAVKGLCLNSSYRGTLTPGRVTQPNVPAGFQVIYILTSGLNNVIEEVNDTASFTVNATGRFTIHTLVYNPNTLDLGIIDFGETTLGELAALLLQGNGEICGSLDMFGSRFDVRDCNCGAIPAVIAYTGSSASRVCATGDLTFVAATVIRRPIVPNGYRSVFVLTSGNNLVIQAVNEIPVFGIRNGTGTYRIHSLVYDPSTLDLSTVQLGVTKAADINRLLRQGGGTICAGLDLNGLLFSIRPCSQVSGLTLYPNPANEFVNLNLPASNGVERIMIELVDYSGNILQKWQMTGGIDKTQLDLSSVLPGNYYVRVFYDQEIAAQTPIVKIR